MRKTSPGVAFDASRYGHNELEHDGLLGRSPTDQLEVDVSMLMRAYAREGSHSLELRRRVGAIEGLHEEAPPCAPSMSSSEAALASTMY